MKILFVCRGNISRSQMAEAMFRQMDKGKNEVFSAGTMLSGPEQTLGELLPGTSNTVVVMKEEGIDITEVRRKTLTKEMADKMDKIVLVVDSRDPIPDYLFDNPKVIKWDVLDTKGQSLEFTREIKNQIKGHLATLSI